MKTDKLAEDLRKYTLCREFTFKEFVDLVKLDEKKAAEVMQLLLLDCHIKPSGKSGWKVIYGEGRQKYIVNKIALTESKIKEYFVILNHMKELKDE